MQRGRQRTSHGLRGRSRLRWAMYCWMQSSRCGIGSMPAASILAQDNAEFTGRGAGVSYCERLIGVISARQSAAAAILQRESYQSRLAASEMVAADRNLPLQDSNDVRQCVPRWLGEPRHNLQWGASATARKTNSGKLHDSNSACDKTHANA